MAAILGVRRGINLLVLAVAVLSLNIFRYHVVVDGARSLSKEEDLELERQLKSLNKPPIKTIHTEWGDILDCVDIYKQPAFDHPLLKNHKIKMKPSFIPKRSGEESSSVNKPKTLSLRDPKDECPQGTVPIRRTRKEDLIRAKSPSPKANIGASNANLTGQYVAGLLYQVTAEAYYGASATINIYNPDSVRPDQFSSAEIMLGSGPHDQMNAIYSGWMVQPKLYGDNVTRLFAFWTSDGSQSGCYNTLCPGFVQVDKRYTPSTPLHISTYEGTQYATDVQIFQDRKKGEWWLVYDKAVHVGYWPNSLFPLFNAGATYIYWGGQVQAGGDKLTPRMGSGHFPDGDYRHSCFFNQIQYMDESNAMVDPDGGKVVTISQCDTWLRVKYYGYKGEEERHTFQFGGPGGICP